jgi:GNAT superfamily N-acetyltransferase
VSQPSSAPPSIGHGGEPGVAIRVRFGATATDGLVLRPITPDDTPFLRDLFASTRADELAATGWSEVECRAFCDSQFDLQDRSYRASFPDARFDVVEADGVPVGRLLVAVREHEVLLLDIALVPGWRNQGLGTLLLRWLQSTAATGHRPLVLTVDVDGPAERLYRRLGFGLLEDGPVHRQLVWRAEAVGPEALDRFLDLAAGDPRLGADLGQAATDDELADRAVAHGLRLGLVFGPAEVVEVQRTNRRAWLERGIR